MAPPEPPSEITIRVKVPQGHIEGTGRDEFQLGTISVSQPISSLRQRIQTLVPSNPEPSIQRLLFGGRALIDDAQTLADALNTRRDPTQNEYVVHLLIRGQAPGAARAGEAVAGQAVPGQGLPGASYTGVPFGRQEQGQGATQAHGGSHFGAGSAPGQIAGLQGRPQVAGAAPEGGSFGQAYHGGLFGPPGSGSLFQSHPPGTLNASANSLFANGHPAGPFSNARSPGTLFNGQGVPFAGPPHQGSLSGGSPGTSAFGIQNAPGSMLNPQTVNRGESLSGGMQSHGGAAPSTSPLPQQDQATANTAPATPGIQTTTNGQPAAHHHHHDHGPHHHIHPHTHGHPPHGRPLSTTGFHVAGTGPDGQRFSYTTQTIVNGQPVPGPQATPFSFPPAMAMPFPGTQQTTAQPPGSALDRARENIIEMQRMLDTMRAENATEQLRGQVTEIEQRVRALNDYIDPFSGFRQARTAPTAGVQARQPSPGQADNLRARAPSAERAAHRPGSGAANDLSHHLIQNLAQAFTGGAPAPGINPSAYPQLSLGRLVQPQRPALPAMHLPHPTMAHPVAPTSLYLLSSPQGPHAILQSPEHGTYVGTTLLHQVGGAPLAQLPGQGQAAQPAQTAQVAQPVVAVPPAAANAVQPPAEQQGGLQAWLGHLWLLVRIMIFSYILLGSGMGWRRPVALSLIAVGFWLIRLGLFGNGGLVRRWWDNLVQIQPARQVAAAQPAQEGAAPRQLPTPEELAQRLIREQRERTPMHRIREQIRPAERVLALFLASLWPGIGERYVQALDRAREEEEAARRAIEAEQAAAVARQAEAVASEQSEKQDGDVKKEGAIEDIQAGSSSEKAKVEASGENVKAETSAESSTT